MLNLYQLKVMSEGPKKLILDVKGPGEIKAKDIQPNPDVENFKSRFSYMSFRWKYKISYGINC